MTEIVGHFLVFTLVAIGFLLTPLLLGKLLRPRIHSPEKDATYECGEPTIGSSYIQFDLRFYVVALLFIIFDVEVVFFFPWATVFGNSVHLTDTSLLATDRVRLSEQILSLASGSLTPDSAISAKTALTLGWLGVVDVLVFFSVLLVGFAYVWKRGDLDWVRASSQRSKFASGSVGGSEKPLRQSNPQAAG